MVERGNSYLSGHFGVVLDEYIAFSRYAIFCTWGLNYTAQTHLSDFSQSRTWVITNSGILSQQLSHRYSEEERLRAIVVCQFNKTISRHQVRFQQTGDTSDRPRSGRPRITTLPFDQLRKDIKCFANTIVQNQLNLVLIQKTVLLWIRPCCNFPLLLWNLGPFGLTAW